VSFRTITYETRAVAGGAVAAVTLNVPAKRNAIGPEMANELLHALARAADDPAVRVLVLSGAGGHFCAGGDIGQMSAEGEGLDFKGDYADLLLAMVRSPKPIVAKVRGTAMGGGLGLVAASHFALAADDAVLGTPEILRGLFPMMIMAVLSRVVPRRPLLEMMLLGQKMTAADGLRLGLLNRALPGDALDAAVEALAGELAARSPTAMTHGLRAWARQGDVAMEHSLPMLRDALAELLGTDDAREGIAAFLQKRPPVWTGK
jgi:enoyl-CoA hydratase/carnithine racemase